MMKKKNSSIFLVVFAGVFLFSMACQSVQVPFLSTPTPSSTITPTATSTPTITPSPTVPPIPNISNAALALMDLPKGFEVIPNPPAATETEKFYGYVDTKSFQIIMGTSIAVMTDDDRIGFDLMLNNPDMLIELFAAEDMKFSNARPIEGMDIYGDKSSGFMADTNIDGLQMVAEFFVMREKNVGGIFINLHRVNKPGAVTTEEVVAILVQKIASVLK